MFCTGASTYETAAKKGASVVSSLVDAQGLINRMHGIANTEFRLFKLGEEIPIAIVTIEEPQPARKVTRLKIKST